MLRRRREEGSLPQPLKSSQPKAGIDMDSFWSSNADRELHKLSKASFWEEASPPAKHRSKVNTAAEVPPPRATSRHSEKGSNVPQPVVSYSRRRTFLWTTTLAKVLSLGQSHVQAKGQ